MAFGRTILGVVLALAFLGPLLGPWLELAFDLRSFAAWGETSRILTLLGNSLSLFAFTSLIAVPWGTALAFALERGGLRFRAFLRFGILMGIVLPVPVLALAWQSVLAGILPRFSLTPGDVLWQPWQRGLVPAAWVHAMVGIPWVAAFVSLSLRRGEAALEEEAWLLGGRPFVMRAVLAPRIVRAMFASMLWLALQTGTEIAITDMMMVRTFAEETYTQLVIGGTGIRTSLALIVPLQIVSTIVFAAIVMKWLRRGTHADGELRNPRSFAIGKVQRWAGAMFAWGTLVLIFGVPFAALMRAAAEGSATPFSRFAAIFRTEGKCLLTSAVAALGTGLLAASLARRCCWAARNSAPFRTGLFALCIALAFSPSPILGFGLKMWIGWLVDVESALVSWELPPIRSALYDQPSPVPAMWAAGLRLFPLACLLLWPTISRIPRELLEQAELDGVNRGNRWRYVVKPATDETFRFAVFLVAAMAMGEVGAAKIANPPFFDVYILRLFDQMHYGSESTVAALALVQWFLSASLGALWWITRTTSSDGARDSSLSPA